MSLCTIIYDFVMRTIRRFYIRMNIETVTCGSEYGGFNIYDKRIKMKENPIVYSFGVGEDISFDLELIRKYNCSVYAFDPTPKAIKWIQEQNQSSKFCFFPYGISYKDGIEKFYLPINPNYVSGSIISGEGLKSDAINVEMKRLSTILLETGGGEGILIF